MSEILRTTRATLLYQDFLIKCKEPFHRMLNQGVSLFLLLKQIKKVLFSHPGAFNSFKKTVQDIQKDLLWPFYLFFFCHDVIFRLHTDAWQYVISKNLSSRGIKFWFTGLTNLLYLIYAYMTYIRSLITINYGEAECLLPVTQCEKLLVRVTSSDDIVSSTLFDKI